MTYLLFPARFLTTLTAIQLLLIGIVHAGGRPTFKWASDREVAITAISNVVIETDKITVTAKASEPRNAKAEFTNIKITFIIKRPPLDFNNAQLAKLLKSTRRGDFAKSLDREQFKKHREKHWKWSLMAAKALQSGDLSGTVSYSKPKEKIHEDKISAMDGYGFLSVKTK